MMDDFLARQREIIEHWTPQLSFARLFWKVDWNLIIMFIIKVKIILNNQIPVGNHYFPLII